MNPLYMPAESQPLYNQTHQNIVIRRNHTLGDLIRFRNVRLAVYPHGANGNHMEIPVRLARQQQEPQQQLQLQLQQQQQQPHIENRSNEEGPEIIEQPEVIEIRPANPPEDLPINVVPNEVQLVQSNQPLPTVPNSVNPIQLPLQNEEPTPRPIRNRRSTVHVLNQGRVHNSPRHMNYRRVLCIICGQTFITNDMTVMCSKCIHRLN